MSSDAFQKYPNSEDRESAPSLPDLLVPFLKDCSGDVHAISDLGPTTAETNPLVTRRPGQRRIRSIWR
jgi:hypothetical protein